MNKKSKPRTNDAVKASRSGHNSETVDRLRAAASWSRYLALVIRQYHTKSPEWEAAKRGRFIRVPYPPDLPQEWTRFHYIAPPVPAALIAKVYESIRQVQDAASPVLRLCRKNADASSIYRFLRETNAYGSVASDYTGFVAALDNLQLQVTGGEPPIPPRPKYKPNPTEESFLRVLRNKGERMKGEPPAMAAVRRYDGSAKETMAVMVRAGLLTNLRDGNGYGLPEWDGKQSRD